MKPNCLAEAKEAALRLLARREYGAYELAQRLLEKGYKIELANQIIQLLNDLHLQSDKRFTKAYIQRRVAKGFGPLSITNELLRIKINSHLIQEEITCYEDRWNEIINGICFKKFGINYFFPDFEKKAKQIRFLQSRGFNLLQINEALSGDS